MYIGDVYKEKERNNFDIFLCGNSKNFSIIFSGAFYFEIFNDNKMTYYLNQYELYEEQVLNIKK